MVTILIVEDNPQDRASYIKALEPQEDLHILQAPDGESALGLLTAYPIDLFLLDVELPGMNGFALASLLRSMPKYELATILFITGYSKNPLDAFREFHCYDFIVKPFSMDEFSRKIQELVQKLRRQDKEPDFRQKMALLSTVHGDILVPVQDILFAEVNQNHYTLQMRDIQFPLVKTSLADIIESVDDPYFMQCHKSFAVNVTAIKAIRKIHYRLYEIQLFGSNRIIDMTSHYYKRVSEALKEYIASKEDAGGETDDMV